MPATTALAAPLVVPVIMSGGAGSRLWPLSTEAAPKQFHALVTERSMLQDTLERVSGDAPVRFLPPIVVCNTAHISLARRQLEQAGVADGLVVAEPVGRNTAAVAAAAARLVGQRHPGALALLLPADHRIADVEGFQAAVARGAAVADERIVTFGIEPTAPETGYGYIQRGERLAPGVHAVARFAEKPARAKAETYLASGEYSWNGGIFLFAPAVLLGELQAFAPEVLAAVDAALPPLEPSDAVVRLDPARFAQVPSVSLDVAVMERTRLAAVAPCEIGWADVGSWSELWRLGPHDAAANVTRGRVAVQDTRGSLVWSEGVTLAVLGMEDVVVVASGDAVIVAPKARAQDVKALVAEAQRLAASARADA